MILLRNLYNSRRIHTISYLAAISGHKSVTATTQTTPKDEFTVIYKLPIIGPIASLSRLKTYQIIATALTVPVTAALQVNEQIPSGLAEVAAAIGITGSLTLVLLGVASKNLVGFLYLNESKLLLRVSFIDFWGNRKNEDYSLDEVVPFSETNASKLTPFTPIKIYDTEDNYKLLRSQGILDTTRFRRVFGETALT